MKIDKICEFCGDDYVATRLKQKYCSKECCYEADKLRKRWERKKGKIDFPEQTCIVCGNIFKPFRSDQITCGGECARRHAYNMSNERLIRQRKLNKKPLDPKKCIVCNKIFKPNSPKQIICGNPNCKRIRGQETTRIRMMSKPKPVVKKANGPSLSELAAEAKRRGISYGDLIAEKERGVKCQNIAQRA